MDFRLGRFFKSRYSTSFPDMLSTYEFTYEHKYRHF